MSSTFNGVDTEFIDKIHATVIQTLRPVDGEGEISRDRRLHALFNDLTCRIDPEVRHHFRNEVPIAQRYYLLLSHYYLEYPEKAEEVLNASIHIWNSLHMPLIFALLFHEYLFIKCANSEENSIKRLASFVKGANKLFWLDLENSSKRFVYIWMFLLKGVLESPQRWDCLLSKRYLDVFDLVSKFYFYYMGDNRLEEFVKCMEIQFAKFPLETPANHVKLNALNMFCNEVVRTMKLMKSEEVLKHYLFCCRCFARNEFKISGKKTLLRLGDLISDLATPGYPLYPTSDIKEEAKRTLNIIWPYGAFLREIIRFSFRLLRPLSFINWFQYRGAQAQSLLAHIWLWITGTIVLILSSVPILSLTFPGHGKNVRQNALDAANRSTQLVTKLSLQGTDSPRRVRFDLPDDTDDDDTPLRSLNTRDRKDYGTDDSSATQPSTNDDDSTNLIDPPYSRTRSPLRPPTSKKRPSINISSAHQLSNINSQNGICNEFDKNGSQESSPILSHSAEDIEDEEDKDDKIDFDDLERYLSYTSALPQTGSPSP